jgi:hypothetical protein
MNSWQKRWVLIEDIFKSTFRKGGAKSPFRKGGANQ